MDVGFIDYCGLFYRVLDLMVCFLRDVFYPLVLYDFNCAPSKVLALYSTAI